MKKSVKNNVALIGFIFLFKISIGQAPDLKSISAFTLFSSVGAIHNNGITDIYGDIGTNNGAYTGDSINVIGNIHLADASSLQASMDLNEIYAEINALACDSMLSTPIGNNSILTSGKVFCMSTALALNGTLYLDAQNIPNAIFIIKIDGALTTLANSAVLLLNSASSCNVYWHVGGEVNLGIDSEFKGTIIANGAIGFYNNAKLEGRALTIAGALNLDNNFLDGCDTDGNLLPIELLSFTCYNDGLNISLNWTTSSEINNDYFTVERSKDGLLFEDILKMEGAGNSTSIRNYSITDFNPYFNTSYYRLKQTDFDGKNSFSNIISANNKNDFSFDIFPNPFHDKLIIILQCR
jgi:hypothetical protein